MRLLPWLGCVLLAIAISLVLASNAAARNFWQTYGSTVPTADGCGCTWNWNQDFFVPRHASSCRYGLFSPCKTSCTTSPAAKWCHPFLAGYTSIYGPCHYRRRNHVYACRCGCTPIAACLKRCRSNKACCCATSGVCAVGCVVPGCVGSVCTLLSGCDFGDASVYRDEPVAALHHVDTSGFEILGSIPVDGSELLTRTDLSQVGQSGGQLLLQPPADALKQLQGIPLQNLNLPQLSPPGTE